jgi:regulator of replication initiation timing
MKMDKLKSIESRYNASLEVSEEDFDWLIEQANEVESLKLAIKHYEDRTMQLFQENKQLKIEFEKLYDNWALGNFKDDSTFFNEFRKILNKLKEEAGVDTFLF